MKMSDLKDGEMGLVLSSTGAIKIEIVQCNLRNKNEKHFQILGATEGQRWVGETSVEVRKLTEEEIDNIRNLIAYPYGQTKTL